mgnify:CR=1 FL=1
MDNPTERRRDRRYLHTLPMSLYRQTVQANAHWAEMVDVSERGLSLLTNEKLNLGELICIELESWDEIIEIPNRNNRCNGIVRWGK